MLDFKEDAALFKEHLAFTNDEVAKIVDNFMKSYKRVRLTKCECKILKQFHKGNHGLPGRYQNALKARDELSDRKCLVDFSSEIHKSVIWAFNELKKGSDDEESCAPVGVRIPSGESEQ